MTKKTKRSKPAAPALGRKATHPEGRTQNISVTLPANMLADLAAIAYEQSGPGRTVSRSEVITDAVRAYLKRKR